MSEGITMSTQPVLGMTRRCKAPYSSEAFRQDLERIRDAWDRFQDTRDRDAVYRYLSAVFERVLYWKSEGRIPLLANIDTGSDLFAALINSTADPTKVDAKTRSKWSRAMRYAEAKKKPSELLRHFIQRKGGINECASRFAAMRRKRSQD